MSSEPPDVVGPILEGFAGLGKPPPPAVAGSSAAALTGARAALRELGQHTLDATSNLVSGLQQAIGETLTAVDAYRDQYQVLWSGSLEIQGLQTAWQEQQVTAEEADFAFAIATGALSLGQLGFKVGKLALGAGAAADAANVASHAQWVEQVAQARSAAVGMGKAVGQDFAELVTKNQGNIGAAEKEMLELWTAAGRPAIQEGATAAELEAVATASKNAIKAADAAKDVFVGTGFQAALGSVNKARIQAQHRLITEMAQQLGTDAASVLAKNGGSYERASTWLVQQLFNKQGWHYLQAAKYGPAVVGDTLKVVEREPDMYSVLSRILAHTEAQVGRAAAAKATGKAVETALSVPPSWSADVAQLTSWATNVKRHGTVYVRENFFTWLKNSAVTMDPALVGTEAAVAGEEVTMLAFSAQDIALLRQVVDAGGDLGKVVASLSPSQINAIQAALAVKKWTQALGPGAVLSTGGLAFPAHFVAGGPAVDVAHFADAFGFTGRSGAGMVGHFLWGWFLSPFRNGVEVWNTVEGLGLASDFLVHHGDGLVAQQTNLQNIVFGLEQVGRAIDRADWSVNIQALRDQFAARVSELEAVARRADLAPAQQAAIRAEAFAAYDASKAELDRIETLVAEVHLVGQRLRDIESTLRSGMETGGDGAIFVVDPDLRQRIEVLRLLLLSFLAQLDAVRKRLPATWTFGPAFGQLPEAALVGPGTAAGVAGVEKALAPVKGKGGKDKAGKATKIGAGIAAAVAAIVGAVLLVGGGGSSESASSKPAVRVAPSPPEPLSQPAPSPPSAPGGGVGQAPRVSGAYEGQVVVERDPAGHVCCVKPLTRWEVLQVRDTTTGAITITLGPVVDGIQVSSPLSATGANFSAGGAGTVAGRANTSVSFDGTVTPENGVQGTLTVGANGTLPTGQPITFDVDLEKVI